MAETWTVTDKTFLITGGASGLGALYAEAFLKEGAKKIAIADINEQLGKATEARLNGQYPGKVFFVKCDVSKEEDIITTFNKVIKELGRLDVLVNNAGIMNDTPEVRRIANDVNWTGLVSFTFKALGHMRKDDGGAGGCIINMSSVAAIQKFQYLPVYAGSKAAVLHFSQSLAEHPFYDETGVRVLTLLIGPTKTALLQGLNGRPYDLRHSEIFEKLCEEARQLEDSQKPESAQAATVKMFKEGPNGSVWLSKSNQPGENVTHIVDEVYAAYLKLSMPVPLQK